MKKATCFNTVLIALFFILDPFFNFCREWTDTYSLGAEIVLGMATPLIFIFFVLCALISITYSIYKCVKERNLKELFPVCIILIGAVLYILCFTPEGFWSELVNFYLTTDFGSLQ